MRVITFLIFFFISCSGFTQTGIGIGIYPTGTETGLGFRSGKETRWAVDGRIAKANLYGEKTKASSFVSEVSLICRVVKLEKVRFHVGLGFKGDWNFTETNKQGPILPIGVEAFPFPFQNAGLFFEAAPFYVTDQNAHYYSGIRTAAGFVFYFPLKPKIKDPK
jgi:hypothetical protein